MQFTSYEFILFAALSVLLYYILPRKARPPFLLCISLVFYYFSGWQNLIFISVTTVTVYLSALLIGKNLEAQSAYVKANRDTLSANEKKEYKNAQKKRRTVWFLLALLLNLAILAVCKYTNFVISNINGIIGQGKLSYLDIILPLGISFYTFQSIGYLMDVWRGTVKAEKSLWRYALFITFFPQLAQGPINRYGDLSQTLCEGAALDKENIRRGLWRVLWGFFKKLVLADRIFIAVSAMITEPESYRGGYILILMLLYTLELYADFTGGIDITIGVSELFGIRMKENFTRPYFSTSLKDYWRRWHISMASWFRDYLFYPVSTSKWMQKLTKSCKNRLGPKVGKRIPVYLASFIVWFSTGLWHGASWNFIVWGLLNFAVLMISEELEPLYQRFGKRFKWSESRGYKVFMMVRTFALICFMNLFDCYATLGQTAGALGSIFLPSAWGKVDLSATGFGIADVIIVFLGFMLILAVGILQKDGKVSVRDLIGKWNYAIRFALFLSLLVIVVLFGIYGIGFDSSQFIYTRF